jgi:diacylglycerol kinase family enzyme
LDDGLLDLVVVQESSRLKTISQLPKLFTGKVERIPGYSRQRVRQATIESDRPMTFHVDGEPVSAGTKLRVRVHPAALRVAVK